MHAKETIGEVLKTASSFLRRSGIAEPRLEAEILLAAFLKMDRLALVLKRDQVLTPEETACFENAVQRRSMGEPAAYIIGEKYFYGRRFMVNKSVLIPRPETELIIEAVKQRLEQRERAGSKELKAADLGTGSGILAVTMALEFQHLFLWAVDISASALIVARRNASLHGVLERICFSRGDYFENIHRSGFPSPFDLVVANPPYLNRDNMAMLPVDVKNYEPLEALRGGEDGLDCYRKILTELPAYLNKPGLVFMEIGDGSRNEVEALFRASGLFSYLNWHCDLSGKARVIEAGAED
ncbi:MAG: peptide chain release factor N(5)-glutamine methyltransferase [Bacillota bacterium]|nr:peptide chain release factor N(5)-glutamine methyltransferase [Bacillota bacterium]